MVIKCEKLKSLNTEKCYLNGKALNEVSQVKYLGHIITNDTTDDADIMRHVSYLYSVGNTLIRKFSFCSKKVKIKLFQSYCMNAYTGHLWINYKQATYNKFKTAYNSILRRLLLIKRFDEGKNYSASQMFASHNVLSLGALLRIAMYSFQRRITESSHPFMHDLSKNVISSFWEFWTNKLRPP